MSNRSDLTSSCPDLFGHARVAASSKPLIYIVDAITWMAGTGLRTGPAMTFIAAEIILTEALAEPGPAIEPLSPEK